MGPRRWIVAGWTDESPREAEKMIERAWITRMALVVVLACGAWACSDPLPLEVAPQAAMGGGPAVNAVDPPETLQDTTIDVTVTGDGFDDGSTVQLMLNGTAAEGVVTNSSSFVDRNTLRANLTVQADAEVALYDVEVTTRRGKKGVGTELFSVKKKAKPGEDPPLEDEMALMTIGLDDDLNPDADVWGASRHEGPVSTTLTDNSVVMDLAWLGARYPSCFPDGLYRGALTLSSPGPGVGEARFNFTGLRSDGVTPEPYQFVMTGSSSGPWPARPNEMTQMVLGSWAIEQTRGGPKNQLCLGEGTFDNAPVAKIHPVPEQGSIAPIDPFLSRPFDGSYPANVILDHTDGDAARMTWWGEAIGRTDALAVNTWELPFGHPVLAVAGGTVLRSGFDPPHYRCGQIVTDQQFVIIEHALPDGRKMASVYKGFSSRNVVPGQVVSAGDPIGAAGSLLCSSTTIQLELRVENPGAQWQFARYVSWMDPYGWSGPGSDPLDDRIRGVNSYWLWLPGEAPELYRESVDEVRDPSSTAWVTRFRPLGVDDASSPNNEFVEIELNPAQNPSGTLDLTGWEIRPRDATPTYAFPSGFQLSSGQPVRVYTGSGTDGATELYWGLAGGIYPNDIGTTCAGLFDGSGVQVAQLCR